MLSLFLVLATPPREEAKRRRGNPEYVSRLRPGDPESLHPHFATSAGARRVRYPTNVAT